jgi:hypothetical protein
VDPNTDDLALLELLKRDLPLIMDQVAGSDRIALNTVPESLLTALTKSVPETAFSKIDGQQYVGVGDYAAFRHTQMVQAMNRMQLRSLELGMIGPTPENLDYAPTLSHWVAVLDPQFGGTILLGTPTGHPTCKGPLSHTSRLCGLDEAGHWARTISRWYRLSEPETGDGIFKRFGERVAGISGLVLKGWQVQQGIAEDRISEGLRNDH